MRLETRYIDIEKSISNIDRNFHIDFISSISIIYGNTDNNAFNTAVTEAEHKSLNSQKILASQASHGVSIVRIWEKTDCSMTTLYLLGVLGIHIDSLAQAGGDSIANTLGVTVVLH